MNEKEYLDYIEEWKKQNKELIESGKCKKVFLECLPRGNHNGGSIDWKNSIEYNIYFIYQKDDGELKIIDYNKDVNKLTVKYDNKPFEIRTRGLKKCQLGGMLKKITSDFKVEIGTIFKDNKRNITIIDRQYNNDKNNKQWKYYKYKCNKCGWNQGWVSEYALLKNQNCVCCSNQTVVEGINDIPTTAPWMVKYFQGGYDEAKMYTKTSNKKIKTKCYNCGFKKEMIISNLYYYHSMGCSCSDGVSYPNKIMFNILEQLNIDFKTEYSPKWITPKRYDFYIPSKNLIIEMDGGFHYKDNSLSGQTNEESIFIDNEKDRLAKEHGLEVVRINCNYKNNDRFEYIKQYLIQSKLSTLIQLSNVNWIKCEEFALSDLVEKVCNLWNSNLDSKAIILKLKNIGRSTVIKYLNIGAKLKKCNYNGKEEIMINAVSNGIKNGKTTSKAVEIFKNNKSLGIFCSCHDLDRKSEKIFKTKLDYRNISLVCNGKRKTYKGYYFKYVSSIVN